MDKAKVIEKVQKLLALSKSSNPHEAELAAQRAGDFLAKYDLTMMEVLAREKGEDVSFIQKAMMETVQEGNYKWEGILIASLAPVFDCEVIRIPGVMRACGNDGFEIFGTKHDMEMLIHFFRFLRMRITNDCRAKFDTKKARASYASGLINAVKQRLDAMYSKKEEALRRADPSSTLDLVVYKADLARQALRKEHPRIVKGNSNKRQMDRNAFMKGAAAGNKVPLSNPIEGGKGGEANQIN